MSIYVPPRPAAAKAGPIGPGAGPLMTEFLLPNVLPNDPRLRMARAVQIGNEVAYVKAAEAVISQKIADPLLGVAWHLEDPQGDTIDETYADPKAVEAYRLIAYPMANLRDAQIAGKRVMTREEIWEVTSRHMGLAGQGAWYLDQVNDFGIPAAIAYVRPDRLEWRGDEWLLDRAPGREGTRIPEDEIRLVQLQTPDEGVWAQGLVDAAYVKAKLNGLIDVHFTQVLQGGGRISGILAPRQGAIDDDAVYQQLVRDWRNITEQPESARRLQVVRAPVDFTKTVNTPDEMKLIDLMGRNRDDLLALWRVPLSQIGGNSPAGLNSGEIRKFDEAALWQNAVTPRLSRFNAVLQGILDNFEAYLGWIPKLVFDIPEFDDDSPRYDKVQKSQFIPLTNDERRGLIGFDPMPDPTQGAAIVMPSTIIPYEQLGQQPQVGVSQLAQGAVPMEAQPVPAQKAKDLASLDRGKQKGRDVTSAVVAALRKQWPDEQLATARQGNWKYDPAYPMAKINADRRPVARNPQKVAGIEAAMNVGAPIDPVIVIKTKRLGEPGTTPIDGWHRLGAAAHIGLDTIPAYVGSGSDQWTQDLLAFNDTIPTPTRKAAFAGLGHLRRNVDARITGPLASSVRRVLDAQRQDIAGRVRARYEEIKRKPHDTSLWWKAPNGQRDPWNTAMTAALEPHLTQVAQTVQGAIRTQLTPQGGKATLAPAGAVRYVLDRGAARVTGINETTRSGLQALIQQGLDEGMGPAELGDAVEAWSGFDEYRGELIARTELMDAYNAAALGSYDELGVEEVQAIDGHGDPECAERDGQIYPLAEAQTIEDHPNGTLDWAPVIKASLPSPEAEQPLAGPLATAPSSSDRKARTLSLLERLMDGDDEERAQMAALMKAVLDVAGREIVIPAPVVNVEAPEPPVVNVPAPVVTVNVPEPAPRVKRVERDEMGDIVRVVEE